ncbi:hypothetical protein GAG94_03040 [Lysinibacillus sphaericus]|nr:hypothetical protein GAG94_03040 [Lysinibacillus sphaericus]
MSIQIIGQELDLAFQELNIKANKMYESKEDEINAKIQVWELEDKEYEKLGLIKEDDWKMEYGWWRNGGCNQYLEFEFTVKGEKMIGFKNNHSWYHSEDYLTECTESNDEPTLPTYNKFSDWFTEYMNLSKLENLAYFAHDLAEINGLTKAEFFVKFEG